MRGEGYRQAQPPGLQPPPQATPRGGLGAGSQQTAVKDSGQILCGQQKETMYNATIFVGFDLSF